MKIFKDQFISRGEMHRFQEFFQGKWIYSGERLQTNDVSYEVDGRCQVYFFHGSNYIYTFTHIVPFEQDLRGYVVDILHKNQKLKSGFLTEETRITFRSRSARIFWLVQISSEMWDYASPYVEQGNGEGTCEIFFDKFVTFMKRLFDEWKALEVSLHVIYFIEVPLHTHIILFLCTQVTHSLTIIFFSRTYIKQSKFTASSETRSMMRNSPETSSIYRDTDGRLYEVNRFALFYITCS